MNGIELATSIAQALGVIWACLTIISGIGAWKREFIGKRRIELAEDVLATFFELKDAIVMIRNPVSWNSEGNSRKKGEGESEAETALLNQAYVVFERYEAKSEVFQRFATLKYRFMAAFGTDTESIFSNSADILKRILFASRKLARYHWPRENAPHLSAKQAEKNMEEIEKNENIIWDFEEEDDEIRSKLQVIQVHLESIVKPVFEEQMKSYNIMTTPFTQLFVWWSKRGERRK